MMLSAKSSVAMSAWPLGQVLIATLLLSLKPAWKIDDINLLLAIRKTKKAKFSILCLAIICLAVCVT
jgi:hypothetical protein